MNCKGQRSRFHACAVGFSLVCHSACLLMASMGSGPGPTGLCIEANIAVTFQLTGNWQLDQWNEGHAPPLKIAPRNPEKWKKSIAKT